MKKVINQSTTERAKLYSKAKNLRKSLEVLKATSVAQGRKGGEKQNEELIQKIIENAGIEESDSFFKYFLLRVL
jgi:hypothetical protein